MLKQLLKRLQQREFSEREEEILNAEMLEAQQLIDENKRLRAFEDLVRAEINKDEEKVKKLNDIDSKIDTLQKDKKRIENVGTLLAMVLTALALVTSVGFTMLAAKLFTNVILQLIFPFISLPICFVAGYPAVKFLGKQSGETQSMLSTLNSEKAMLLDEVYKKVESELSVEEKKITIPKIQRYRIIETAKTEDNITTV